MKPRFLADVLRIVGVLGVLWIVAQHFGPPELITLAVCVVLFIVASLVER